MNTQALEQVASHVESLPDPDSLDMLVIAVPTGDDQLCGTTACIAGWGLLLNRRSLEEIREKMRGGIVMREAQELFDLSDDGAFRLFYLSNWPEPFRLQYRCSYNRETRNQVTAARIRHFIATEE